jgi:transposase
MININFTESDIKQLQYERFHHPHPRVQIKMEAILLKTQDFRHKEICKVIGISGNTLRGYIRDYREGGIEKLKEINFYKPKNELEKHRDTIKEYFSKYPPANIKEAMHKIQEITGIKRSENRIRKYLKKIGMKRRKVGMIPAKADVEEQERFVREELTPRLKEAEDGKRIVLFVDAAHFVLNAFLGFLWTFTRIFIKAPAGRKRFNVIGALNAINHEVIKVCNDTYINAETVCELLQNIAKQYIGLPITLILDNARYQKCKIVQELAVSLNIELLYLPAYSPNLNIIERLWKFVKKKCLWSKYYADFKDFKTAISECLNQTHTTFKNDLETLLTLNFQTFKKTHIMAV